MAQAETKLEFLQRVQAARVIEDSINASATLDDAKAAATAREAAEILVERRVLTDFQAQVLIDREDIPLVIGEYVVTDKLGRGGMGYVLKARHRRMQRDVAIKFLHPEFTASDELRRRFEREVRTAAQLHHQNIVTAYDAGEHSNGSCYLVMQYVAGNDLSHLVKKVGPLSIPKTIDIIRQAAEGLAFAHEKGIVHRDIKPGNLLLDHDGVVRILDLGLARMRPSTGDSLDGQSESDLTATGNVMGTVDYMAPEQALDAKGVDHRADIYALGCTLYFLLTGTPPYRCNTVMRRLLAHREGPIPSLCSLSQRVPLELDEILKCMLAKQKEDRFASMRQLIEALKAVPLAGLDDEPIARPDRDAGPEFDPTLARNDEPNATRPLPLTREQVASARPMLGQTEQALEGSITLDRNDPTPVEATVSFKPDVVRPTANDEHAADVRRPGLLPRLITIIVLIGCIAGGLFVMSKMEKESLPTPLTSIDRASKDQVVTPTTETSATLDPMPTVVEPQAVTTAAPVAEPKPVVLSPVEILTSPDYEWSKPENLGPVVNTDRRENGPVLLGDERTLFFGRDGVLHQARRANIDEPFDSVKMVAGDFDADPNIDRVLHEGVSLTSDGLVLVFGSIRTGSEREDVWMSTRQTVDEPFSKARRLPPPINSDQFDRAAVLSPDGLRIWVSSTRTGTRSSDILQFSRRSRDAGFDQEVPVGMHLNTEQWDTPACVTSDGLGLIKNELPGTGIGCLLHVRANVDEPFGPGEPFGAVHMGKPFVSADGRRVYFHSRENPDGYGNLDLYVIRRVPKKK